MASHPSAVPELYTTREIAYAAGTSFDDAGALVESGRIAVREGGWVQAEEAVRAVLFLRGLQAGPTPARQLFGPHLENNRRRAAPLTASSLLHVAFGAALILALGFTTEA